MRKINSLLVLLCISVFIFVVSCNYKNQDEQAIQIKSDENDPLAITKESIIKFKQDTFDFQNISGDKPVTHKFIFTNVGKRPLVISQIKTSCGCTTLDYTIKPVYPGKKGYVKVNFDPTDFEGDIFKTVFISGNFETKIISIKAKIIK